MSVGSAWTRSRARGKGSTDCAVFPFGTWVCRQTRPPQALEPEASCKPPCRCRANRVLQRRMRQESRGGCTRRVSCAVPIDRCRAGRRPVTGTRIATGRSISGVIGEGGLVREPGHRRRARRRVPPDQALAGEGFRHARQHRPASRNGTRHSVARRNPAVLRREGRGRVTRRVPTGSDGMGRYPARRSMTVVALGSADGAWAGADSDPCSHSRPRTSPRRTAARVASARPDTSSLR